MRSVQERKDKYNAKTVPANVSAVVNAQLPGMQDAFANKIESVSIMENQVQVELNGLNVPTIRYPFYLNFGRELWALIDRGISGDSLISMAQALKVKWVNRGLESANLITIAADVFALTLT